MLKANVTRTKSRARRIEVCSIDAFKIVCCEIIILENVEYSRFMIISTESVENKLNLRRVISLKHIFLIVDVNE